VSDYSTPGQYLEQLRRSAGMVPVDVALCIDTTPPVSVEARMKLVEAIEADLVPLREAELAALAAIPWLALDRREMAAVIARLGDDERQQKLTLRIVGAPIIIPATPA
jgi:hypothetical protein